MKYRKKPVVIDAVQWDGTLSGWRKIESAFPKMRTTTIHYHEERNEARSIRIATLEGSYDVSDRDYIIRGVKGEFYPCKHDIFEMTYDKAEDEPQDTKVDLQTVNQQLKAEIAALAEELQDFNDRRVCKFGRVSEITEKMRQLSDV